MTRTTVDYLKSQIETADPSRIKTALQQLCKYCRNGNAIPASQLNGIEQSIVRLLYDQGDKEKVRRWALNALARIGRESTCLMAIIEAFKKYNNDPQTSAAAIAAIFRLSKQATEIIKKIGFDEQLVVLAALQHIDSVNLDLSVLPIETDNASADILKLALIIVGLNRAPPNMLHPRLNNSQIVKALGTHHDEVVAQYTVWAITENPELSLDDLGIDIRNIESQPSNVRAWVFQLIAMGPEDAEHYFDFIELGSTDASVEARAGLAIGLKNTYFDGIEELVLGWFARETDLDVFQHLLDHMVKQAKFCTEYETFVLEAYEKEPSNSPQRQRIEMYASGSPLFAKLKRLDSTPGLFKEFREDN